MNWLGYNDAASEAKTRIFQPTANFENFEKYLVCQPACRKTLLHYSEV